MLHGGDAAASSAAWSLLRGLQSPLLLLLCLLPLQVIKFKKFAYVSLECGWYTGMPTALPAPSSTNKSQYVAQPWLVGSIITGATGTA